MATTHQKEALKVLRPLGYRPLGYNTSGELVVTHEVGYSMAIHETPSDYKTMKNMLSEARRGIKRMQHAGPQFEMWLWKKYSIQPGETKRLTISIQGEIHNFFTENGIERGASKDAVSQWYRAHGNLVNTNPDQKGGGKRTWDISRPLGEEIVTIAEPELSIEDETVELEEEVPPLVGAIELPVSGVQVDSAVQRLNPDLIRRLEDAFNEPVRAELSEQKERLSLVLGELEALDHHLQQSIEYTLKARETILGLVQLLEG